MSFLTELTARRMATVSRAALRTSVPRASFTTTVQMRKTPVEATKDTLKNVDRAVSDKLVDGINVATKATEKVKDAIPDKGEAAKMRGEAQGKAQELKGEAKGTASQAKGAAEEKAGELKGTVKEKVNEL